MGIFGGAQQARARFFDDLGTALDAGLGIREALTTLGHGSGDGLAVMALERRIHEGSTTLSDAMGAAPERWSIFERRVIEAGERGGRLPLVMKRLARHFEQQGAARDRVGYGLIYPVGLVHAACVIGPLYLLFTEGLTAYLARAIGPLVGLYVLVIGAFFVLRTLRASDAGRRATDGLLLATPGLGGISRTIAIVEYSSTLGALFASGVPAVEAMEQAAGATRNGVIAAAGKRAVERVRAGDRMHEALASEPDFPRILVEAVRLGETSGKMDDALERVERGAREDADRKVKMLATAVPVVAYLCAVAVIGYTIVSVYMSAVVAPMREAMGK